jgi:hypothetical protein
VVGVYPAPGSELDLTQDVIEITFSFSEPMNTRATGHKLVCDESKEWAELGIPDNWWENSGWRDDRTYVVSLKSDWIRSAGISGITLNSFIQSKTNYGLKSDYTVTYSNF